MSTPRITAHIELRRAQQRFLTRTDWAETYHSFSFGEHYDPTNVSFGRLMVNNDDLVRVGAGYPTIPIVTPRSSPGYFPARLSMRTRTATRA